MKLGIRSKLFVTILMTSILVVIGMMLFTRWSIHSGFVAFVEDSQAQKIALISENLTEYYDETESWDQLSNNRRLWLRIVFGHPNRPIARYHDDDDDDHHHHGRRPSPPNLPINHFLEDKSDLWPSDRVLRLLQRNERHLPFETRLMLFDENKEPVFGRTDQLSNSQLFPLTEYGQTVGYLALIHGPSLTETGHIRFIEKQHSGLIFIALGIIALSALISILLSQRLVQPVQKFQQATREMAAGNYASRVEIKRRDELGELAKDINALGESLLANELARKQWVADIAHELRTPLSVLRGELEALQSGIRPIDSDAINSLHDDALRLGRLINDLYQLSVTDLGALNYKKEPLLINEILEEDIDRISKRFSESKIKISTDLGNTVNIQVAGDSQRLSQLFGNLLKNSLRYTDQDGELLISSKLEQNHILINFMDSSPGVPEEALGQLFNRLYRVDNSRNRDTGGAGLGLAIAYNIVTAHDGEIHAKHSPLGGLWLEIILPVEPAL